MNEILVKDGETTHIYKSTCGCSVKIKPEKPEKEESISLPPMILVDNCNCTWHLSVITVEGIDYWAVDGVILVDRNWNPVPVTKLVLDI